MDIGAVSAGNQDAMERVVDDPWTTGLKANHPGIYYRLERWLDFLAEYNGHERVPDEPKQKPRGPTINTERLKARGAQIRKEIDDRNLADLKRLLNHEITEQDLVAERGYKNWDSVRDSMYVTNKRGGFGEHAYLYERWKELVM